MDKLEGKILLVDDEEQFLEILTERLAHRGLKVSGATSGEEALSQIEEHSFDVIIVDLAMPGIDGIETLKLIKEQQPDVEIIMLTGHATVKDGIEAMKLGVEDFLEKPVDLELLLERIHDAKSKRMLVLEQKSKAEVNKIITRKGW